ncbi:serpin peptidase inhibitor, clade F (alpha-2 antiplasmin, pigment epithelium derived factor), member 2b isoform X1 [Cynoglossus semilaevis]|uniref:serpin peptidase inhibitor, clade F (alpha-2 antiplasmin, pigment epithelium derived factor), member 2b isoform X1 n=1 Tax=Cynoglossus semilaevis TaxID=244447 RepID=UPI0004974592|nr:alpha-2-antiplasmin isoform X1 [Cynoglossus semilaevis]XP_008307598.1 alpha-2-antiplasmin isoform X1 [Cynoglossus semilaevis]XP_024910778.1 alpha-2-antiplasmin isoform X1 [Cynoglossus semilaevis]
MDLRLTLLLIFFCSPGVINSETVQDESAPTVPLIPLIPGLFTEETKNETTAPPTEASPTGGSSEEEPEEGCMAIGRNLESRQAIAAAIQKLGLELLQNLERTPDKPNIIISPLSISLALSQLALGAVNETDELLMNRLHNNTLPCYHHALRHILNRLRKNKLKIATRIFLRQGFEPKQDFVNESLRLYSSEAEVLESLEQINSWVEKATQGQMTNFLPSLPPNLLILLINAVHFKGVWKARFDPRFTSRGVFYLNDHHMVDVEVMEDAKHPLSLYIHNDLEAQVARFPFRKSMSLLVALPLYSHVDVYNMYTKINISDLYQRLPKERAVQVKVPKFTLDYTQDLQDVLTKMGLGELFSAPNLANLADGPLVVSSIKHKSSLEINEEGAEAAAATSVVISRASNPIFHLTRPFFFALVDDNTMVPIFMGVINNPSPGAPVLKREQVTRDKVAYPVDKSYDSSSGGLPK